MKLTKVETSVFYMYGTQPKKSRKQIKGQQKYYRQPDIKMWPTIKMRQNKIVQLLEEKNVIDMREHQTAQIS